jgi:hypothetical protein
MPEMRLDPAPRPQTEPEPAPQSPPASDPAPEPQLPELKDPVERTSATPRVLLLLALVACAAGGAYWWKFAQVPESAPPTANAAIPESSATGAPPASTPQTAPATAPSGDPPPLQRVRELLRADIAPEQAVELAKDMRKTAEGVDGAFLLLEDAAQKGSPEGMLGLARFYDPADTTPKGSIRPDPTQAYDWYNKAKDKGQGAADDALKALRAWTEAEKDKNPQAKNLLENWK